MKNFEKQLYNIINEKYLGEDQEEKMSVEERKSFLEAVSNFHKLGEMIYSNAKLQEVTETLKSVMERAEKVTMSESEHWFDNVTVSRHMKQMNEAMKVFEKTAGEMSGLQQRLESAYEDMGTVLNRYYKINEALAEDQYTAGVDDEGPALKDEDINIDAKTLKKINPNLLKKLSKNIDINIDEDAKPDYLDMDKDGDTEEPMKNAIKSEEINISSDVLKKINPNVLRKLSKKMDITIDELKEKLVYYKDKENRLRRFDTDKSKNKKYEG